MAERIYTEAAMGGLGASWCKMARSSIEAAEVSDLNTVQRRAELMSTEVRKLVVDTADGLERRLRSLEDDIDFTRGSLERCEDQIAALRSTSEQMLVLLKSGGGLQEMFADITEQHLQSIGESVAELRADIDRAAVSLSDLESAARTSAHAASTSATTAASTKSESRQLLEEAIGVINDASVVLKSCEEQAAAFNRYRERAEWSTFIGRLRWLLRGSGPDNHDHLEASPGEDTKN